MFNWTKKTNEEYELLYRIYLRANLLGIHRNMLDFEMDIEAVHQTCPLKLQELLDAEDNDFLYDVCGIIQNLDRTTGELRNCFRPQYAQ